MQKITAVPCGAVSSDRSQMGPLLYGRLSFSAENSPSLLNVFKNLLQILQVASCETEKVQPQSWFRVRACRLGSPAPSFFSALPSPLSIFDPKGYPAAKSADLAGLVVPVRPAQRRAVDSAPRGPEGNPVGRGAASETWGQLGAPQAAGVDGTGKAGGWGPRGLNLRRKRTAPSLASGFPGPFSPAERRPASPGNFRGRAKPGKGAGAASGTGKGVQAASRASGAPRDPAWGDAAAEVGLGHLPGERGRSASQLSAQSTSAHLRAAGCRSGPQVSHSWTHMGLETPLQKHLDLC